MAKHPGIRIDRIPVTATITGLVFVAGTLYIFLVGVPVLRFFLVVGLAGGLTVGLLRYFRRRRQSKEKILDIGAGDRYIR
jgi:hypothetical protein